MMVDDPRRQDVVARHGVPLVLSLDVPGNQAGKTAKFNVGLRGAVDDTALTMAITMTVGTYAAATDSTPLTLQLGEESSPGVNELVPGVVYVYRVQLDEGPPVAWGQLDIAAEF